jgi:hypothetical protein
VGDNGIYIYIYIKYMGRKENLSIYLSTYLSMAQQFLVGPRPLFEFIKNIYSRYDSLDGGGKQIRDINTECGLKTSQKSLHGRQELEG